jgi:cysteine sulfinate desulfinase/cysteine desulfurase-like protein
MKRAYMDHAAATPVRPEVLAAMLPFFEHLPPAVENLRSFSPVWRQKMGKVAGVPK